MNVGFCQLVRRAPWGRRSVATKWGSQPLGSNLNGDAKVLIHSFQQIRLWDLPSSSPAILELGDRIAFGTSPQRHMEINHLDNFLFFLQDLASVANGAIHRTWLGEDCRLNAAQWKSSDLNAILRITNFTICCESLVFCSSDLGLDMWMMLRVSCPTPAFQILCITESLDQPQAFTTF